MRVVQPEETAMYSVSVILTSYEWQKVLQAARKQFSNEVLSCGEICRRYVGRAGEDEQGGQEEIGARVPVR